MDKNALRKIQNTGEQICLEAGKILLKYRGKAQVLRSKTDFGDIVTEADEASEKYIINSLKSAFPFHNFLSEESGQGETQSDYRWIIDPLDGTKEFARGVPLFAVNLALEYKQKLVLGIIYQPVVQELFSSALDQGTSVNGTPVHVSEIASLDKAIVYVHPPRGTESPETFDRIWRTLGEIGKHIYRLKTGSLEQFFSCWIARGAYEAFWMSAPYPSWWDVAPFVPIISEAGGKVTTALGNNVTELNFHKEGLVASNGKIHNQLLALIQKGGLYE